MTARLRAKPSSSTPVPRPAQRAPPPPNKAAAIAAAAVVLPMPISPRPMRSHCDATASYPAVTAARNYCSLSAGRAGDLIDRGTAGGKIRHHLRRDLGGIGGDAAPGHAVTAGKDQNIDALQPRRHVALPISEPRDQILEPAEALRRLGQA